VPYLFMIELAVDGIDGDAEALAHAERVLEAMRLELKFRDADADEDAVSVRVVRLVG
jgi:hypothetical protein